MIKKIFILSVFTLSAINLFAQSSMDFFSEIEKKSESGGEVNISQPKELFQATNEHIYFVKTHKMVYGYQIWIFTGKKIDFERVRSHFVDKFPEYKPHVEYEASDLIIYVGDFLRRNIAEKALREIKQEFPAAFIRPSYLDFDDVKITD